jgi:hypothetical protein
MASTSIQIQATASDVFDYVSDLPRHGEWASHRLSIEPEHAGDIKVGSRFLSRGEQFGLQQHDTLTITAYEPNMVFAFESRGRGGAWRHTYEIEATDDGVRLTRRMEPVGRMLRLLNPLFNLGLSRRNQKDLERLKVILERSAAT